MKLPVCAIIAALVLVLAADPVRAEPKPWIFGWWPSHWENLNFVEPYLDGPKHPHNTQWDSQGWETADWAAQREGGTLEVIHDYYRAGVLQRQYVDDHMPVLEVGPNFYHLSGQDKRRITRLIDDHFQITTNHLNAMYTLRDGRTGRPIGTYTAYGLHLQ